MPNNVQREREREAASGAMTKLALGRWQKTATTNYKKQCQIKRQQKTHAHTNMHIK